MHNIYTYIYIHIYIEREREKIFYALLSLYHRGLDCM